MFKLTTMLKEDSFAMDGPSLMSSKVVFLHGGSGLGNDEPGASFQGLLFKHKMSFSWFSPVNYRSGYEASG